MGFPQISLTFAYPFQRVFAYWMPLSLILGTYLLLKAVIAFLPGGKNSKAGDDSSKNTTEVSAASSAQTEGEE